MGARWFCNSCGIEIWQGLDADQKKTETVADMEHRCMCSDCIIKNQGFHIDKELKE
jgi:hypothetical protein